MNARHLSCISAATFLLPAALLAADTTTPGAVVIDPPTAHAIGLTWEIEGDDNGNVRVDAEYRRSGDPSWRQGLPFLRVENQPIVDFDPGNIAAGSIFDLEPATSYEVRLTLSDPDGGNATETVTVTTRALPPETDLTGAIVIGPDIEGSTAGATHVGLAAADQSAQPGDVFLLLPGRYSGHTFATDGQLAAPITYHGTGAGEAVIEGTGGSDIVLVATNRHNLVFEGLSVRNSSRGFNGDHSQNLVIRNCRFDIIRTSGDPVGIYLAGAATGAHICDNRLVGPETWAVRDNDAYGVLIAGQGHTVCHNYVRNFWDGINTVWSDSRTISNDIFGNLILDSTDDGIETDGSIRHTRVYRNRIGNTLNGISAQPVYGGPIYLIRNEVYNVEGTPYKFHNRGDCTNDPDHAYRPSGLLVLHNSTASATKAFKTGGCLGHGDYYNSYFRNNLFYVNHADGYHYLIDVRTGTDDYVTSSIWYPLFDYNGWAPSAASPPVVKFDGEIRYDTLELFEATGHMGSHHLLIDHTAWVDVNPDMAGYSGSAPYEPDQWDYTLAEGSPAIDTALPLANINDSYTGTGPDRGALEKGAPLPHYGPRGEAPVQPDAGSPDAGDEVDAGAGHDTGTATDSGQRSDATTAPDAATSTDGDPSWDIHDLVPDTGSRVDAGLVVGGGCGGCSVTSPDRPLLPWLSGALLLLLVRLMRRRSRVTSMKTFGIHAISTAMAFAFMVCGCTKPPLVWQNPAPDLEVNWEDAGHHCNDLEVDGQLNWRLPNINELRELVRNCRYLEEGGACKLDDSHCLDNSCTEFCDSCDYDGKANTGDCLWAEETGGPCDLPYWSSTAMGEAGVTSHHWTINYGTGQLLLTPDSNLRHVRCLLDEENE